LCGMKPWTNRYARGHMNDVQWRYDELNHQIASALDRGPVPYPRARSLAGFLNPESFPGYFDDNARSRDGKEIVINGSVSLFNLGRRTMESHYGYYGDKWVKTDLKRYIE